MASNTYVALKTTTVATATASVTLDTIPAGYTDLVLVVNGGLATTSQSFRFQVGNGTIDTGNNYSYTYIAGNGSTVSASRVANTSGFNAYHAAGQSDANLKNNVIVHFQNYSNTSVFKTILNRGNSDLETAATIALWRSTSAIDRILIGTTNGNIVAGTTISLYGVAAASVGAKATGGTIYADANYWYHAFAASGTFTPTQSLTADILVVAGGGGAGINSGGGAGGLLGFSSQSLTATGYTVTVGAGGAAGSGNPVVGAANGSDSQFGALTLVKGGGYGGIESGTRAGNVGGSGGGEGAAGTGGGGTPVSGQGYAGGTSGGFAGNYPGGGGGGAGGVGGNATSTTVAGNGGIGSSTYSSWSSATGIGELVSGTYYIAGGGGASCFTAAGSTAGAGGYGGGGAGKLDGTTSPGKPNTGGGGGASNSRSTGGAGGSGIVIVRYAK